MIKVGETVYTPRFCTVRIEKTFDNFHDANNEGYNEPTHYVGECYVFGKHNDFNHMTFAAVQKRLGCRWNTTDEK